ncbi:MAG: SUMF1/EgtB/PvdO family nonheme iron enzyme, partial [Verrucomicrobiae bacterium]|nr:SUMF1/EgtB/PvdO family nonheme iron enzyme [Verrucomicrobiae bacterium]
ANPPADLMAAVSHRPASTLPDLPEGSPEPLVVLRQTWTTESGKIRATLDAALQQSLQALETELTRARDFENAQTVLAYRESLATPAFTAAAASATPSAPSVPEPSDSAATDTDLARATKEAPFENSLGMKFVPVPETDVLFCIHEVRYRDYAEYAKSADNIVPNWKNQTHDGFTIKDSPEDHPMVYVSWEEAQAFCVWLSEKEGKTYRLPTDREWSHAVGIGLEEDWKDDTTPATVFNVPDAFPWGDEWPPPKGAGNYSDQSRQEKAPRDDAQYVEGGYDDGFPTTAPVMNFEANKLGLYDLGGNVWEWCDDWYSVEQKDRVLRGGSWNSNGRGSLLSSYRRRNSPGSHYDYVGFRVVLETGAPAPIAASTTPPGPRSVPGLTAPDSDPDLARATKDAPFENSLGMKFVPVPGTDVLFGIHEVRYRDYAAYAEENPGINAKWQNQTHDGFTIKDDPEDHPVVWVNWEDAQAFCAWLSEKEGKTYRLPTDREWSLAVGIGRKEDWKDDTTPETVFKVPDAFPWGDDWPPPTGAGNYSDQSRQEEAPRGTAKYVEGGYDDGFPTTAPVMRFEANKLGLYDLSGNVWEWCEDWYSGEQKDRVLRGGSWHNNERVDLRSSIRSRFTPGTRSIGSSHGFRVVLETSAPDPVVASTTPPAPRPVSGLKNPAPDLARATKDVPFENTLGMKFVPVPRTDVLFGIHEVRHRDYAAYAKENPGINAKWQNQTHEGFALTERLEDHPVVFVSWEDAQAFCAWLSGKEGKTYRLPTDREWSFAAGIGRDEKWTRDTTPETVNRPEGYPWGSKWPPPEGTMNCCDESRQAKAPSKNSPWVEGYDDGFSTTAPVMSFEPNKLGLFDLGGNVREWCEDWLSSEKTFRVVRGASWDDSDEGYFRSSHRHQNLPTRSEKRVGFRVVVELAPPAATAP